MGFLTNFKETFEKREPEILSALGLAGGVLTIGLAIGATVLAVKAVEKKTEEKREAESSDDKTESESGDIQVKEEEVKLSKVEVAKTVWKYYVPVLVIGAASGYCIVRSSKGYASRLVTLTAAYKLSEKNRTEVMDKVKELLGEKETQRINDEIAQQRVNDNPPDEECIPRTGNGSTLCREELTGRYFYSSQQAIQVAVGNLNYEMLQCMWVSVNDLFDQLEIDEVALGEDVGWSAENGKIDVIFATAKTPNGTPILTIDFRNLPGPRPSHLR